LITHPVHDYPELARALGLSTSHDSHEHVAIVGGGGKTTTMFALGAQLAGSRILTTTTKMGADQHRGLPVLLDPNDDQIRQFHTGAYASEPADPNQVFHPVPPDAGQVVIWRATDGSKALGVHPDDCDRWFTEVDHVVVEADGARRRPFKAPKPGEPVIPNSTTRFVVVMGANALGRVIIDQCQRPLRVAALADCRPGDRLTAEGAVRVITHERGYRPHVPEGAAVSVVVTQATAEPESAAGQQRTEAVAELYERLQSVANQPWWRHHDFRVVLIRSFGDASIPSKKR